MLTKIPNMLTMGRIAVIPVMIAALIWLDSPLGNWVAFSFYTFACLTDFFDGYLARALAQQSAFGRFLDPIADKLLVASVLLLLIGVGRIHDLIVFPAAVILCREILVSGLREFLAEVRVPMPVTALAKWKTGIQMLALGFLLVGPAGPDFGPLTTTEIGIYGLWAAALLTIVTGADYLVVGIRQIAAVDKQEDKDRTASDVASKSKPDITSTS